MIIVIRAGGGGTRLWPVSRKKEPKQFQAFINDKTLVQNTYERIAPLLESPGDMYVSIGDGFEDILKEQIPETIDKNIISEPAKKDTGPAIGLEVAILSEENDDDTVIATIPSDAYISDDEAFRRLLMRTETFLQENPDAIVTPGVKLSEADTGYSYMKAGEKMDEEGEEAVFMVEDWVEKPDYDRCQELIDSGIYYAHAGIYIWRLGAVRALFEELRPALYKTCQKVAKLLRSGDPEDKKEAEGLYNTVEKESIETAITDRAPKVAMSVSNRMGWSDLGKWYTLHDLLQKGDSTNVVKEADVVLEDVAHTLIVAPKGKTVTAIGLHDLVIIDTPDALFVANKKQSGEVKKIVEKLQQEGRDDVL